MHDNKIPPQNHTSLKLQNDTTYNYNCMKQIISRVEHEWKMQQEK